MVKFRPFDLFHLADCLHNLKLKVGFKSSGLDSNNVFSLLSANRARSGPEGHRGGSVLPARPFFRMTAGEEVSLKWTRSHNDRISERFLCCDNTLITWPLFALTVSLSVMLVNRHNWVC